MYFTFILLLCSTLQAAVAPTIAERKAALQRAAVPKAVNPQAPVTSVIRDAVKVAEAQTLNTFLGLYKAAIANPTYKLRMMVYLLRSKTIQDKAFAKASFTPGVATGIKAPLATFNPTPDAENLKMIAAYAPYNNSTRVTKEDVAAFKARYPNLVVGVDVKNLEGDILPLSADGRKVAYNPFSYGMVLVYRLRNQGKLGGEKPTVVDLYDKEKAFSWEKAAGYAKESVGK